MSWNDLQLAQISGPIDVLVATVRQKRRSSIDGGNPLEFTALELCFEFLTIKELLQSVVHVCVLFHDVVVQSQTLLTGPYCRQWRANKMLPKSYVTLCYHDQITLCTARRADALYELSTRSAVTRLPNGTYDVVNNSMLRSFATGSIDSIRGVKKLPLLSCAQALHKQISYFEVSLQGSGSVGLVSISDGAARGAYGFGSREHVGWNGVSYGYHGNDGDFVFNDGTKPYGGERRAFGPLWGRASTAQCKQESSRVATVGCGLDAGKREVFFTLNGEMIGVARTTEVLPGDYAAAVSLHAFGDRAVINAGAAPFVFDIEAFCASP
uniref:SPRY domain-containing protein n=1 Tax=Hyaloperonospora arabidopsidis (strain Emoy2) TaxID=559515 RepID=M4BNL1_HYAAE